jgi:hypothetical protein
MPHDVTFASTLPSTLYKMALITSSSPSTLPDFVDAYYAQKPNFADLASSDSESEGDEELEHEKETEKEEKEGVFAEKSLEDALKDLKLHPEVFGRKTLKDFRKGFKRKDKMPAHPAEEYTGGSEFKFNFIFNHFVMPSLPRQSHAFLAGWEKVLGLIVLP